MGKKGRKKTVANQLEYIVSLLLLFSFFLSFFPHLFLANVSRRLKPLMFISREHSPMLSETAWY